MSDKLQIKWIVPPPKNLDAAMEVIDFNIIFHKDTDVEVTTIFHYKDPKAKSILGQFSRAKRTTRGNPKEVFSIINKSLNAKKDDFYNKWLAAKALFNQRSPFNLSNNETLYNYVNNYGMTPKKFKVKTGVDDTVLFRELKGQRKLSLDKAVKYAKALGCDPVDLLFEKQHCKLWGSVDLFNMTEAGNDNFWQGQIMPAPMVEEGKPEKGLLSDQLIPVPRDIYRPEMKAILINSLGSYLHNHYVFYYRKDTADTALENKLVVVGRDIPELEELGMDTMQYFFGILKIEKGKQKLINPEPTSEKTLLTSGPFSFIAPVISLVKRGAMKKDHNYFESITQAEEIKEAEQKILETQRKAEAQLQKTLDKLNYYIEQIKKLSEKERAVLRDKLNMKKIFSTLEEIPAYIRKKTG